MTRPRENGFSLIELAIVLAIIGLLAGGIVGGQSLIHSAKLNTVLTDANKYADAKSQFKDQYGYLPGDFPTAVKVWGKADGNTNLDTNCAAPSTDVSADGIKTCNGNGDGYIKWAGTGWANEAFSAWTQLAAAGYITGKYTGVAGPALVYDSQIGINEPAGALPNTGYFMWSWGIIPTDDGTFFAGDYNSVITFGAKAASNWTETAALTPSEAYSMDKKADDGFPGRGSIRPIYASRTACNTTTASDTSIYATSSTGVGCTLLFLNTYRNKSQL